MPASKTAVMFSAGYLEGYLQDLPEEVRRHWAVVREFVGTATRCSCIEIFGEDPNCATHGDGTAWAQENRDD